MAVLVLPSDSCLSQPLLLLQADWGHMPHDILVAIVRLAGPADAKACHRVCRSWHYAVRCGTEALTPSAKHCAFPKIRECFPRVPDPAPARRLTRACSPANAHLGALV